MTNIRRIRATCFSSANWKLAGNNFETGLRVDGHYYFRNSFIEIPNEFKTCPIYYPKMFFSHITTLVEQILETNIEEEHESISWSISVDYDTGEQKTILDSRPLNELIQFLNYDNLISYSTTEWDSKQIINAPRSNRISLDDVRGEVSAKTITLGRLIKDRLDTMLRGSLNESVVFTEDGGVRILLKNDPATNEESSIEISSLGHIENTGNILYLDILKENDVVVLFSNGPLDLTAEESRQELKLITYLGFYEDKLLNRAFPVLPEALRIMFYDPMYILGDEDHEFSFANRKEYLIYCRRYRCSGKVIWNSSEKYLDAYNRAYDFFEDSDFEKAASGYLDCLRENPIGIEARFELTNSYIKQGKLGQAKMSLAVLKDLLFEPDDISKFYRTLGYIFCEEGEYRLSYACYKYSRKLGGWYEIKDELNNEYIYIRYKAKRAGERDYDHYSVMDCKEELELYGIPILKENREAVRD